MTSKQWNEFVSLIGMCRRGGFSSINVASKERSEALIAVFELLDELPQKVVRLVEQRCTINGAPLTPQQGVIIIRAIEEILRGNVDD